MAKKNTVESKVAQSILQEYATIEVGEKTYSVAPPSLATLIKVSELVSQMPGVDVDTDDPIGEALRVAKDCGVIADIIAAIILGAKRIKEVCEPGAAYRWKLPCGRKQTGRMQTEFEKLAETLRYEKTPRELSDILADMLVNRMDIGFFLAISTSLSGVNMTTPTKNATTASGQ